MKWLIFLSAISCWILLNSNLAAVKIWSFFGIPVDGGIVLFPLSYIFGDIIVEFYGKELANKVVGASFLTSLGATIVFLIVDKLEPFPGWGLQEAYHSILGLAPRIMIGSIIAYLISGLLNNYVFENMRKKTGYLARALTSSVVARFVDNLIFETIAFLGILSFKDFLAQAAFAYAAGMMLETLMAFLTTPVVRIIRRIESKNSEQ